MPDYQRYYATGIIEDKTGLLPLKFYATNGTFAGANNLFISGVAGKKIRVVQFVISAGTVAGGAVLFRDGNGGPILWPYFSTAIAQFANAGKDFNPAGWCETSVGTALYGDNAFGATYLALGYVEVTP